MMKKLLLIAFCLLTATIHAQDDCASAVLVTQGVYTVDAVNGTEAAVPCSGAAAAAAEWFAYVPSEDFYVTVSTDLPQNNGGDTRFHVYSGTCGALVCEAGDDDDGSGYLSIDSFNATQGTTYYIAFDNRWSSAGFDFEITEGDPPPPPPPTPVTFTTQGVSTSGSNFAAVDMNNDCLDDLVSISSTNVNILFQGTSGFTTRNISTPQADFPPSWSLAAGDLNDDGYNDLLYGNGQGVTFMTAVVDPGNIDNGDDYDDVTGFTERSTSEYVFSQRSNFADINNDGNLDGFVCHDVDANVYYLNDGSGNLTFYQGGLGNVTGNYGSVWIDYDNDRDLDMFIAKCGSGPINQMLTNDGNGNYTENATSLNLADGIQTWSSAWGDYDNDGDMDVFVGASSGSHKLMRNDGGTFTDITSGSGVTALTATSIEHATHDFDNDGNLDVFSGGNILFGNGDMTFSLQSNLLPTGSFGDLNNDGFVDLFNNATIYMNDANDNNWVKIATRGTTSNLNGIGARVEIHTDSGVQIRDVRSGEGFRYMSSLNVHVGIGTDTAINNIIIYWPSGIVDNVTNPAINTFHKIVEGETLSIEDQTISDLVLYPNPAKDVINFTTTVELEGKIATVFDINGKRVLNRKLTENKLNVSVLQAGMYFLQIESEGKTLKRKFIKE